MTGQGFQDLGLQATSTGGGCACCSPTSHATAATDTGAPAQQTAAGETVSAQFLVEGMTCAHCVRSVTEEVSAIDGVSDVAVDLHAGGVSTVTVSSATPVDAERVRAAVEEAGYSLASAS
ncbi:MAG: copper chaperone [Actinobacteria bacterium]|jgi:copper chaperone|uniref:heavy-metal-associated domain-containing protein n=1 Tax=unclassified Microbacterium TaxID=2609290 RepID=UPI000C5DC6DB|nr:heavy-metal-associated domain-containing protein [Microbacterium sp. UBA837]MAT19504.1 copper resistance protein CopZ [Leifsonia sp.]MEC8762338.1 heavy-metal-associated domain-containing protein [Actinomycetota bacterium]HCM50871.1 copper chaperone [Microbacterium sp.]RUA27259.1 MAG: copper chaperone [Actinomycetota bacterium]HCU78773.1 copper chaperone [Microbacterium sp.]|tara:strand:+ start:74 stop:433 length:360 start_codon:yes stop_codon:yes gene_type:complete